MSETISTGKFVTGGGAHDFPLIVSFPQGIPENVEEMQINASRKSSKLSKTQLSTKLNGISYKGANFGELAGKDGYKYAIGVHSSKNNHIKIIPTDHIFVLKPHMQVVEAAARPSSMSYAERKQSLTEEFGSSKKKRALKAAQSNIISAENISGASALESSLTAPQVDNTLIDAAKANLSRNKGKRGR